MSELKKHQLHIHQDKSCASINERGGFGGNQGVFYIANGTREFVSGSYLAFDHLDRLTEGEKLVFILKTKIAFHCNKYVLQLLRHTSLEANGVSLFNIHIQGSIKRTVLKAPSL